MKKTVLFLSLALAACGGKPSEADYMAVANDIREKMCARMEKCAAEMMADIPENMRQAAMAQVSKEKCMSAPETAVTPPGPEQRSKEDLEKARACAAVLSSVTCEQIKSGRIPGCELLK